MSSHSRADLLRYKIAPKYPLSGPFHHSGLRRNPEVAGRFVAIISFLHTPVRSPPPALGETQQAELTGAVQELPEMSGIEMTNWDPSAGSGGKWCGSLSRSVSALA